MTSKNNPLPPTNNDSLADDVKAATIAARIDDRRLIENALHCVEQAIMLKYIAVQRFASFSPAKRQRIVAQAKKLDAAILLLAHVFDEANAEANEAKAAPKQPLTIEETLALADRQRAWPDASDGTIAG